jgi:hypothetical protein
MTEASPGRIAKKGKVATTRRDFAPQEIIELQELNRVAFARGWEASQIKGNTALIPRGQEVAAEAEAVARLIENAKNQWVAAKLTECGYPAGTKCSINLSTGQILLEEK